MIVHISDDGTLGYCAGVGGHGFWMSMTPHPAGYFAEHYPNPSMFTPYGVLLRHPDGVSPSYERLIYPFVFFKVRSYERRQEERAEDDLFVLDFTCHQAWKAQRNP